MEKKILRLDSRDIGDRAEHIQAYGEIIDTKALCEEYESLHECYFIHECKDRWSSDDYEYSAHLKMKMDIIYDIIIHRGVEVNYTLENGFTFTGLDPRVTI